MPDDLKTIRSEIAGDPSNAAMAQLGYEPLFTASAQSRIVVIGQAPGRRAQESGVPWDDPSGVKLRDWLGVDEKCFYDPESIALVPMDFFYPGQRQGRRFAAEEGLRPDLASADPRPDA